MVGRMRSVDDTGTVADRLLLVEIVVGTKLLRTATLQNKLNYYNKSDDSRMERLEPRIRADVRRWRLFRDDQAAASHSGAGALSHPCLRPPASTALFSFDDLGSAEIVASSMAMPAAAGAETSVVITASLAADAPIRTDQQLPLPEPSAPTLGTGPPHGSGAPVNNPTPKPLWQTIFPKTLMTSEQRYPS